MSVPPGREEVAGEPDPRPAPLLTPERVRNYSAILGGGGLLALVLSTVARTALPQDNGALLPDFLAHWTGGRMLVEQRLDQLYDPSAQHALQVAVGIPSSDLAWFVSPPVVVLLFAPLALLPYVVACGLWTAVSVGALVASLRRLALFAPGIVQRHRRLVTGVVLASYPVFELLGGGQDSALTLLVWVTGIGLAVSGRDVAAGLVFSLGALKPQLVVLVPVVFLLQRRLRGLVAFGAGVAALAAGSVALVGWNGVVSWAAALGSPLYTDQVTVGQSWKMASVPALVTALAAPAGHGTAVALGYAAAAVLLAVFATWVYRRPRARLWCWTTALLTTVVASPHVVLYDALLVVPPALFALEWVGTPVVRRATAVAFCLAWLTPLLHVVFGSAGGVLSWGQAPWVAVPIAVLWWQVGHAPQPPTSAREVASEHAEQVGRP